MVAVFGGAGVGGVRKLTLKPGDRVGLAKHTEEEEASYCGEE